MKLSKEKIQKFYATLIEIIEEKYNVKIEYSLIENQKEQAEKKERN